MIEKIIEASVKNKFLVVLATLFVIAGGLYAMARIPLDAIPDLSDVQRLAIANPRTAPYGAAAMQAMSKLTFPSGDPQIAEAQSVAGVNAAVAAGGAADQGSGEPILLTRRKR